MVALAAVLVMDPALVVFDEPTTQLDLRNRNRVRDAIAGLATTPSWSATTWRCWRISTGCW